MTTLSEAVLSILLSLPGPWEDPARAELPAARAARLETIATAIGVVAEENAPGWRWSARELAAALVAVTYPESQRFHRDVHSGKKRGDCKAGKPCAAACLGQVHSGTLVSRDEWRRSMGTDLEATTVCMTLTARVLVASSQCISRGRDLDQPQVSALFTMYATGRRCRPPIRLAK